MDNKQTMEKPVQNMGNAKRMVKQYWKEFGGWPMTRRRVAPMTVWEACLCFLMMVFCFFNRFRENDHRML